MIKQNYTANLIIKKILLTILSLTLLCQSIDSFAVNWPVVNNNQPNDDQIDGNKSLLNRISNDNDALIINPVHENQDQNIASERFSFSAFHEKIVQKFIQKGLLSNQAKITNIKEDRLTQEVVGLIYVEDCNFKKIIKLYKMNASCNPKNIINDLNFVNKIKLLALKNNLKIPNLIVSSAEIQVLDNITAEIQTLAKGESLQDISILDMHNEDIKEMFKNIGIQMGNLDRLFKENGLPLVVHPDGHIGNLFYDPITKEFSWIDIAYISTAGNMYGIEGSLFDNQFGINLLKPSDKLQGSLEPRLFTKPTPRAALIVKSLGEGYIAAYSDGWFYYTQKVRTSELYQYFKDLNDNAQQIDLLIKHPSLAWMN
ncbi:MAG: hypothetical protein Q8S31_03435 [Alphaproteobacteria bacterium]|nr:hypothetical protein [Alphaproteobacteria bacterium]